MEKTLSFIKPHLVKQNKIGEVIAMLEAAGLSLIAAKMIHLTKEEAEDFYSVHKGKHFFDILVSSIIAGPIFVMALQAPQAIQKNREVMGATDPKKAAPGTIRALFGNMENMEQNAVHGSDAPETAVREISFFFSELDL